MRPLIITRPRNAGFTIVEMLAAIAIMIVLMAGIFAQLSKLQQVYRTEETKVDATKEGRNLLDEIARELHQAGYPGDNLFAPNILVVPSSNDQRVAVGLVRVTPAQLWFEGDIDSDGTVDVVQYMLYDSGGNPVTAASSCPCTLQRSQVPKANAAPLAQATNFTSGLSNVINSTGAGAAGAALPIAGNTNGTANDVLYAAYKNPNVFTALDQNGNPVAMPVDFTNPVALAAVKSVIVTVNTLSLSENMAGRARIPFTVTMTAKINN
jgi:type II secretory pathway pseudopilin PulG